MCALMLPGMKMIPSLSHIIHAAAVAVATMAFAASIKLLLEKVFVSESKNVSQLKGSKTKTDTLQYNEITKKSVSIGFFLFGFNRFFLFVCFLGLNNAQISTE